MRQSALECGSSAHIPSKRVEILEELAQPQSAIKVLVRIPHGRIRGDVHVDSNQRVGRGPAEKQCELQRFPTVPSQVWRRDRWNWGWGDEDTLCEKLALHSGCVHICVSPRLPERAAWRRLRDCAQQTPTITAASTVLL
jgi:hypothetical protein